MTDLYDEMGFDDEPAWDDSDHAWAKEGSQEILRAEAMLGRKFGKGELQALVDGAARADTLGDTFDALDALDGYYAEQGTSPPDLNTRQGRVQHMATRMAEEREAQEADEADAAEPVEPVGPSHRGRSDRMAAIMRQSFEEA